jgi:hypothetical protein
MLLIESRVLFSPSWASLLAWGHTGGRDGGFATALWTGYKINAQNKP